MPLRTARPNLVHGITAVLVALIIAALAVTDHRRVGRRSHRADVAGWFCERKGTHCDELQPAALESRWEIRERSYEGAFGVALVVGASAAVSAVRRRRA
jgi:hypothetical protein